MINEQAHIDTPYEATLDNLIEGMQLIDFDWRYLYVNKSVVKQSKYESKDHLLGFTMMEKYPGIEKTEMFATLQECMNNRVRKVIENEFKFPDGSKGWFELRIEPVPRGIFILSMDISDRKNAMEIMEATVKSRTAEIVQQKEIIEEKNKYITESIRYARRIQNAILPKRKEIYSTFPKSFILYKPKDIVSGDFYFFHKNENETLLAAADCTGHGVPGALMSVLGTQILCSALLNNTTTVSSLLSELNLGIKKLLKQSEVEDTTRDGMDIALCAVDSSQKTLKYSGANRPLWIIRKGANEITEIKATKKAIGGFTDNEQNFDTHEIQLQPGDTFYLFSDGYADMFGGLSGKKLMIKKFKEILLSIKELDMQTQKKHLNTFADEWMAGTEQTDDILIVGVRV